MGNTRIGHTFFSMCGMAMLAALLCTIVCLSPSLAASSAPPIPEDTRDQTAPSPSPTSILQQVLFMTEQYPPFNYLKDNRLQGISIDIFNAVMHRLNSPVTSQTVRHLPWARAYKIALSTPNTCLFVMTRSPVREHLFKWVGPIMPTTIAVIAHKSRGLRIGSAKDLSRYSIAALESDIGHSLLLKHGYPENKIAKNPYAQGIIEMLYLERIDAWAYEESVARYFIRTSGYDPGDFENIFTLERAELYFAFSASTDDAVIAPFRDAFTQLQQEGEVDSIIARHIN